jgi:aminopeptidase N
MMHDDQRFRQLLRDLNSSFYHQTVTSVQIEQFITQRSGIDLRAFFDQYLRTVEVPASYKKPAP